MVIQMSKKTLNLFTNGHLYITFAMVKTINTQQFSVKRATMTIECTISQLHMLTCSVPLHSFKFIAALQHAAGKTNRAPFLLRHHLKAGHGAGKPTKKVINEASERFAFMMIATGTEYVQGG